MKKIKLLCLLMVTHLLSIAQYNIDGNYTINGNVGIGTNASISQLHMASDSDHAFTISRKDGTYGFRILRNAQEGNVFSNRNYSKFMGNKN